MSQVTETKFDNALRILKSGIVNGTYAPGDRMPSQSTMCTELGVGASTIQRVYDKLAEEGFIHVGARRSGTHVAKNPPHLCNYGFLMPDRGQWSLYFGALRDAVRIVEDQLQVQFREYLTSSDITSRRDVHQLSRDVVGRKLGGLVIVTPLHDIEMTPALKQVGLPRVFVNGEAEPGLPTVAFDVWGSFLPRAIEYLAARGCRRVAHIRFAGEVEDFGRFQEVLAKSGIERRSYWEQGFFGRAVNENISNAVELLVQLDGDKRPDALIIHDDNLVDGTMAGLMAAGIRVPEDLKVISHCNYPLQARNAFPIKLLGFDCCELIRECLRIIEMIRDGLTPLDYVNIPAKFDHEMDVNSVVAASMHRL